MPPSLRMKKLMIGMPIPAVINLLSMAMTARRAAGPELISSAPQFVTSMRFLYISRINTSVCAWD